MKKNLIANATVSVNAPATKVWKALTDPTLIKQYLFGTDVTTDWKEGHPIVWKGEYEGKTYQDKGVIKKIEPNKVLQHTYLSSMSGKADKPENYATVSYQLVGEGESTILFLSQDHNEDEKARASSIKNWKSVLTKLKEVVEQVVEQN